MPPIHSGLYPSPSTQSPPPFSPPKALLKAHSSHPSSFGIHLDFEATEDLIDYHEICYNVDAQLKYETLHPPPLLIPTNSTHPKLPDHRAFSLPACSKYITQKPHQTTSQRDYDPSSLAVDHTTSILLVDNVANSMDETIPITIDDTSFHDFDVPILLSTSLPYGLPPTIRPIDKTNASLPQIMSKNWDLMQKLVGFMNMDLVLKHLNTIALDTIVVQNLGRNPTTDREEKATSPNIVGIRAIDLVLTTSAPYYTMT